MQSVWSRVVTAVAVLVLLAGIVIAETAVVQHQRTIQSTAPFVVASRVDVSHDFATCSIRFANHGNTTDATRSVMLFYVRADNLDSVVRNADPPPSIIIKPGQTADWDCASSFAGSPLGIDGEAVNVVVSAIVSRERASVGNFT